jgi:DNA-binding NtrC family response regulator
MIAILTGEAGIAQVVIDEAYVRGCPARRFDDVQSALQAEPRVMFVHCEKGRTLDSVLAALAEIKKAGRAIPVIVLAAPANFKFLKRFRADGAADVLLCPPDPGEIGGEIDDYCRTEGPAEQQEIAGFRKIIKELLIGQNAAFKRRLEDVRRAARSDANVLLLGETGTGKEMAAKAIHRLSRRSNEPYQAVNCAGLADTLIESELFGTVKGAFTGAIARRGHFEAAGGGTLLLDEIGGIKTPFQMKLLRAIDQREFQRVGDTNVTKLNARLICATSADLDEAVASGAFGPDLLGRIRQIQIVLPPLRERKDDIRLLCAHFLEKHAKARKVEVSSSTMEILERYDFPMNVRELENIMVAALASSEKGEHILPRHLPEYMATQKDEARGRVLKIRVPSSGAYEDIRTAAGREVDRQILAPAFEKNAGNVSRTADELGIDRKTVGSRMEQLQTGKADGA